MFEEHVFMCASAFLKRVKVDSNTCDIITRTMQHVTSPQSGACACSAWRVADRGEIDSFADAARAREACWRADCANAGSSELEVFFS
jgi:hypothetical protein